MTPVFSSEGQTAVDAKLGTESAPTWPTGKQRPRGAGKKDSLPGAATLTHFRKDKAQSDSSSQRGHSDRKFLPCLRGSEMQGPQSQPCGW